MYGNGAASGTHAPLADIEIANIPDRNGQFLRNALIDRLHLNGAPSVPTHILKVENLKERLRDLDVTVLSDTTREQITFTADMILENLEDPGKTVQMKNVRVSGSYNILANEYAVRSSRKALREDLLEKLALQIERKISVSILHSQSITE